MPNTGPSKSCSRPRPCRYFRFGCTSMLDVVRRVQHDLAADLGHEVQLPHGRGLRVLDQVQRTRTGLSGNSSPPTSKFL